jgi:predicted LPLAT superfamily acyltransferase
MSNITITDKTATAYRNRRAMEMARERLAFAASCNDGMAALSGFVSKFRLELASGAVAGLALFVAGVAFGLI